MLRSLRFAMAAEKLYMSPVDTCATVCCCLRVCSSYGLAMASQATLQKVEKVGHCWFVVHVSYIY